MTVTVLAIFDEFNQNAPLAKVMKERLIRLAAELQDVHLKSLTTIEPLTEDVVVYISYNPKFTVRWRIVNDVPLAIEKEVAEHCATLGYIVWKTAAINVFKGKE
ncbi:hypothetical protein [Pedobacter sp. Hv1]|uniref:hypothetical protein n=1 Tax=Pedobacter sp. Hv1 TaxID=1740090 RepID=UPI0006D8A342|nr:hypothetical protein [Pedobacter sp. Hv1]KQC00590.1 hypothetical protein AQF98_07840 [Pedobacter sp. Hv1]